MAKNVVTARGEKLDLEDLVERAKRPLNYQNPAAQITPASPPRVNTAINMRGFMPAQSSIPAPSGEPVSEAIIPGVAVPLLGSNDSRTLADMTKLRIDKTTTLKVKPGHKPSPGDGIAEAEATVKGVSKGLRSAHQSNASKSVVDDLDDAAEGIES